MTMAPSIKAPMAMAIPPRDMILAFKPCRFMMMKAIRTLIGMVMMATRADLM